jgi:bifunctional DNA-binding transcriptional regulator/antitoxin component of YhaV-PrlF toxin-antitoxin module
MSMDATVELQELEDGELFFEIPDSVWEQLGWDEGTVLDWTVVGDSIRISKVPEKFHGQSGVEGDVSRVERSDITVETGDGGVVGEPSF